MSDAASTFLKKMEFSDDEKKGIVEMIKDIHDKLQFKKIIQLLPLEISQRPAKQIEFLKEEIANRRKLMIYCYNQVVNKNNQSDDSELRAFSVKIDESILKKDKVYKKILEFTPPLLEGDKIEQLQYKIHREYPVTKDVYNEMISKIEKTCKKILEHVGDVIAKDPEKLAFIMLLVIDTVHDAEIKAIPFINDKSDEKETEEAKKTEDPCDANKRLGVDWSFLGIFPKLPNECVEKVDSTKISIVGPVKLSGGRTSKKRSTWRHLSKGKRRRKTKWRRNI